MKDDAGQPDGEPLPTGRAGYPQIPHDPLFVHPFAGRPDKLPFPDASTGLLTGGDLNNFGRWKSNLHQSLNF